MSKMGTELLKEQYNHLLNDQKSKLERLKQKKQQMIQPANNNNVTLICVFKNRGNNCNNLILI